MSAAVIAAIIEVAGKIYTAYNDKEENRALISEFSNMLSLAHAELISQLTDIIGNALSQDKIKDCNDRLESLAMFFSEYANNPLDIDKLRCIDRETQFLLNRLDDPQDSLPAIHVYLGAASLRIDALALKSEFEPGDKINAVNLARRSIDYAKSVKILLADSPRQRISLIYDADVHLDMYNRGDDANPFHYCVCTGTVRKDRNIIKSIKYDTQDEGEDNISRYGGGILIGNRLKKAKQRCLEDGVNYMGGRLEKLKNEQIAEITASLPLTEIDKCIDGWSAFASM
jgi:hypothetical protein